MNPDQGQPQNNNNPSQNSTGSNNGMAILAYLGILIIIPFLTEAKNDPYVKFHLRQGITLIISFVVAMVIGYIPVLGWILAPLLMLFNCIMIIIGVINAATGKQKELPLIGHYARNFNF